MQLIIHTDGGSRGNPGPAAVGVVIDDGKSRVAEFGKRIGETTNNVAEYRAVIEALRYIQTHTDIESVQFFLDSTLVVNQLNGIFRVKDARLRGFLLDVRSLEQGIGKPIRYTAVPREQNSRADYWVNRALDAGV